MRASIYNLSKSPDGFELLCIDRLLADYIYMLSRANQNLGRCRYPGAAPGREISAQILGISARLLRSEPRSQEVPA